jgi:hypothetical protein
VASILTTAEIALYKQLRHPVACVESLNPASVKELPSREVSGSVFVGLSNPRQLLLYAGVIVLVIIALILARLRWRE